MGIIINAGDPQPINCSICDNKEGYRVIETYRGFTDIVYNKEGKYMAVYDSESRKVLSTAKSAYCSSCLNKLNFKIN